MTRDMEVQIGTVPVGSFSHFIDPDQIRLEWCGTGTGTVDPEKLPPPLQKKGGNWKRAVFLCEFQKINQTI